MVLLALAGCARPEFNFTKLSRLQARVLEIIHNDEIPLPGFCRPGGLDSHRNRHRGIHERHASTGKASHRPDSTTMRSKLLSPTLTVTSAHISE